MFEAGSKLNFQKYSVSSDLVYNCMWSFEGSHEYF